LIDNVLLGGAPVPKSLVEKIQAYTPNFYESYGMTETMSHVAIKNLKITYSNFIALGNTSFTTSNDSLIIHAPHLGIEALETNDQVELISSTEFKWLGRKDFVIISGGKKFHPELLEKKIEKSHVEEFKRIVIKVNGLEKEKKENIKIGISEITKTFEHYGFETKREKSGVKVEIIKNAIRPK
jgi:O-succinylbenzoic acid--CoA ligase